MLPPHVMARAGNHSCWKKVSYGIFAIPTSRIVNSSMDEKQAQKGTRILTMQKVMFGNNPIEGCGPSKW
jgi:hypothetical protein